MKKPSSRERNLASKAPYDPGPFTTRLAELLKKANETYRETAIKSGLDLQSVRRYAGGERRPSLMACLLLADHFRVNPNEFLELAGWPPMQVFDIELESAENLPTEAVDVAKDIARIPDPGMRKEVAQAIRILIKNYFG